MDSCICHVLYFPSCIETLRVDFCLQKAAWPPQISKEQTTGSEEK
jgi:hypothetical protein